MGGFGKKMTPRIRVLVAAFDTVPGQNSHSSAVLGMANALHAEIDVVTLRVPGLAHQTQIGGARVFRVSVQGTPSERRQMFHRAVKRQIQGQPYDIVHVRGPHAGMAAISLQRQLGFSLIYEVASFPSENEGPQGQLEWTQSHNHCLQSASAILVGTEAAADALAADECSPRVEVIPPGIDIDRFDWRPPTHSEDVTRLLYLGPLGGDRDIGTLLDATAQLASRRPVHVLIAGEVEPARRDAARRALTERGIGAQVDIRGRPEAASIASLIGGCDIGLVTAARSPRFRDLGDLPEPFLEFLACKRPIVVADVPAVRTIVQQDTEALFYTPGDARSLASAVERAMNPTRRSQLALRGYEKVRRSFTSAARRRRIAEVYERLAPGSQTHDPWSLREDSSVTELPSDLLKAETDSVSQDALAGEPTRAFVPSQIVATFSHDDPIDHFATPVRSRPPNEERTQIAPSPLAAMPEMDLEQLGGELLPEGTSPGKGTTGPHEVIPFGPDEGTTPGEFVGERTDLSKIEIPMPRGEDDPELDAPPTPPKTSPSKKRPTAAQDTGEVDADTGEVDVDTGEVDADTGEVDADTGEVGTDTGEVDADTGEVDADTGEVGTDTGEVDAPPRRERPAKRKPHDTNRTPLTDLGKRSDHRDTQPTTPSAAPNAKPGLPLLKKVRRVRPQATTVGMPPTRPAPRAGKQEDHDPLLDTVEHQAEPDTGETESPESNAEAPRDHGKAPRVQRKPPEVSRSRKRFPRTPVPPSRDEEE